MRNTVNALLLTLALAGVAFISYAQDSDPQAQEKAEAYFKTQAAKLHPQSGKITLQGNLATLNLPPEFGYLPPDQTEILIHDIWQNPPGHKTLGAIVPAGADFSTHGSWAAIITYNDDGHVKDEDADTLDYDKMLTEMKEANRQENEKRRQEGYTPYALAGWAASPHYDKVSHKLYWALDLKPEGGDRDSLNYNIRILGRKGYLVLSLVGGMDQLPQIEKGAGTILSFIDFNATHRYEDFNPDTDKVAAYGMAALIGGYALAKVGLFKGLIVALIALKKFVILGVVAVVAFFKRLFARKKNCLSSSRD